MPLFIKNKLVFIHIPKTGGTSIEEEFKNRGDEPLFFSSEYKINNHSPQHSTYNELKNWNFIPDNFKVFTIIRHPYERFISEYNYRYIKDLPESLTDFSKKFLGLCKNWDNHHLSCSEFIEGSKNIEIIKFENLQEDFKKLTKFSLTKHEMKRNKIINLKDLTPIIKEGIFNMWSKDFINFNYKQY